MREEQFEQKEVERARRREKKKRTQMKMSGKRTRETLRLWEKRKNAAID